jgi:hypothetical protein
MAKLALVLMVVLVIAPWLSTITITSRYRCRSRRMKKMLAWARHA